MTGNVHEDACCSLLAVTCVAAVNTTHSCVAMALHSVFSAFLTVTGAPVQYFCGSSCYVNMQQCYFVCT
jgi:hypothetical protein